MKRIFQILLVGIIVAGTLVLYINSVDTSEESRPDYYEKYKRDYRIYSPPLPSKMDFAGEEVPLNSFYVSEMLDREILVNSYWHSNTLLLFKRANRWFPVIEPILRKNKVPSDFKYLALIESGLINITSPAGAKGFWQLMKATGNQYGLEINSEIDERYNVEKATEAACRYLLDAYKIYGSWTEAAASYNMGMGGLNKQMRNQGEESYYDLSLNSETSRYVYRILAVKAIFSSPKSYGFYLREADLYPPLKYKVVLIDSTINNMGDFAKANEVSYRMLKELNPWLLTTSLLNKNSKSYEILLPEKELMNYQNLREKQSHEIGIFGDRN